ncbi:protein SPT2 homolog isoform X1 [Esox lucius]|uniref:Protein SPT2 homolog n=1 Tax=Esox lucius TaxID=8010 RepID=A0A3P9AKE4_ESOLU|nr:protein SPT2 homolog isoform X1 [Esox lucius]
MDFENVLSIASQNQGLSSVPKRYSLQTGPPKKDPKVKGVNSAAVQAFLKKKEMENKKKELLSMKKKEHLLAKRVELKSDRKARAMASRTKDNFRGYNGIPVVDEPKKRRSRGDREEEQHQNNTYDEDYEDNYEYAQTDSETEPDPEGPRQTAPSSSPKPPKRPGGPLKPAPPPMNFTELLKLAQKKQFEPVEVKAKPSKKGEPERLRTADEIRELELERKAKKLGKGGKDYRPSEREHNRDKHKDRERGNKSQASFSSSRKSTSDRDINNGKQPLRSSLERPFSGGQSKKTKPVLPPSKLSERSQHCSSKPSQDRDRPKTSLISSSSSSGALSSKAPAKGASSQISAKNLTQRPSSAGQKTTATSDLNPPRKGNLSLPPSRPSNSGVRTSAAPHSAQARPQGSGQSRPACSGQARPGHGSSGRPGNTGGTPRPGNGETVRPGGNSSARPGNNGQMRPTSVGPSRPGGPPQARLGGPPQARLGGPPQARLGGPPQARLGGPPQARPGGPPQARPGSGSSQGRPGGGAIRPGAGGPMAGRPASGVGSGPGRPKCSVVAETISSKTFGGARGGPHNPGMPLNRPGMPPRPGMQPRPIMRPPGTMLPPITSAYKRKYEEEEEYDSEMEDFIDDEGEPQDEISKHIREIFGYDRTKYKEESDYALKFMESSWRDQQKEEARSLRLGIKEDEDEMRLEEEEMKKKMAMNAKRKKV